ncbi:MAG: Gfo/Idh/MocA family oxidoreductase [Chloroflexi bacterium]|nr:Gfo/Idh/MocA family oxidoreductase [Chloroflexota bacterium]
MTLKLAIVGCGGMGLRHAFAYIELRKHFDSFDLVAVCDRHAESANHVASEVESATGRRPRVYTDFDQLLATENGIDAVDITTDTRMHHSFAIGAMESGASVLTEKPMGLTMAACRDMAETAERTGKVLSIGEQYRRDPMNRLTKALVESGIIGRVSFAMKVSLSGGSALMHNTGWRALKSRAGSIIIEQGVHEIDLLIYLLGNVKHVYSATGLFTPLRRRQELNSALKNFYDHRVEDEFENRQEIRIDQEDTALAVLKFEAGPIGQFTITNSSHGYSAGMNSVHGDKGTILLPHSRTGRPPTVNLEGRDEPLSHDELLEAVPDWSLDAITATFFGNRTRMASYELDFETIDRVLVAIELQELAEAIESGKPIEVGPDEGMQALGVIYGVLESGLSGSEIAVADVIAGTVDAYQRPIDLEIGIA